MRKQDIDIFKGETEKADECKVQVTKGRMILMECCFEEKADAECSIYSAKSWL